MQRSFLLWWSSVGAHLARGGEAVIHRLIQTRAVRRKDKHLNMPIYMHAGVPIFNISHQRTRPKRLAATSAVAFLCSWIPVVILCQVLSCSLENMCSNPPSLCVSLFFLVSRLKRGVGGFLEGTGWRRSLWCDYKDTQQASGKRWKGRSRSKIDPGGKAKE